MAIFHLSFSNGKVGKGLAHFKYIMGEDRYSYKENEVIYEKSTKTLELILTSVSAKAHFLSKMVVGWLAIFI